ncbi:hypothetical protein L917_18826 [Phytophthora nicotianae]|uniref:Uncharacterized protein n=1 Tax=Phytophthora nicotianae TaxID=4792 RepID=W2K8K1_PHYNI|nr:hypothetical protein L917_18826 [Phytophthora nicotianae]
MGKRFATTRQSIADFKRQVNQRASVACYGMISAHWGRLRTRPFFGWIVDTAKSLFRHYCRVIVAGKCKPYFGVLKPSSPQLE